jgi:hypothetical protein
MRVPFRLAAPNTLPWCDCPPGCSVSFHLRRLLSPYLGTPVRVTECPAFAGVAPKVILPKYDR